MGAVAELDTSIATSKVRTNELFPMTDIFRNDKISRLIIASFEKTEKEDKREQDTVSH